MRVCLVSMSVVVAWAGCEVPDELGVDGLELAAGSVRNGKIAYARLTVLPSGTGWGVNVVNPDGSGLTRLPPGSEVTQEFDPAFSPDGKKILFASTDYPYTEIYRMNADGACLTRLTTSPVGNYKPSWSPDGQRIAFERRCRIYTMNADGSNVVALEVGRCNDPDNQAGEPKWSPDGTKILFGSTRDPNGDLFTMSPDGTGIVNLTNHSAGDRNGDWSPDGSQIVFYSDRDGGDIYLMDADGGQVTRLTYTVGSVREPSWSPDGEKIAFWNSGALYKMNADGTGMRFVAGEADVGSAIDWGPQFDGVSVAWMNATLVDQVCNSLTKDTVATPAWNAGAASVETLDGDGALEFTTAETTTDKMVGLSNGDDGVSWQDIDFAIHLRDDGALLVRESGSFSRRVGSYAAGDTFRVRVKAGVVTYWQNGLKLYRSLATPTLPLLVDASLRTPGATINDVTLEAD